MPFEAEVSDWQRVADSILGFWGLGVCTVFLEIKLLLFFSEKFKNQNVDSRLP